MNRVTPNTIDSLPKSVDLLSKVQRVAPTSNKSDRYKRQDKSFESFFKKEKAKLAGDTK